MSHTGTPTSPRGGWNPARESYVAESSNGARSAPLLESSGSTSRPRMRDKLRPWKTTVAGRQKSGFFSSNDSNSRKRDPDLVAGDPYVHAAVASNANATVNTPIRSPGARNTPEVTPTEDNVERGYEWEENSDGGSDSMEPDAYSWVDPSLLGTSAFRGSPAGSSRDVRSPGAASSLLEEPLVPLAAPDPPPVCVINLSVCTFFLKMLTSRTPPDPPSTRTTRTTCLSPFKPTHTPPVAITLVISLAASHLFHQQMQLIVVPRAHSGTSLLTNRYCTRWARMKRAGRDYGSK